MDELSKIEALLDASITSGMEYDNKGLPKSASMSSEEKPVKAKDAVSAEAALAVQKKAPARKEAPAAAQAEAQPKESKAKPEKSAVKKAETEVRDKGKAEKAKAKKPVRKDKAEPPKKPKKKMSGFAKGMIVYGLLFALLAAGGVTALWRYMDAYEKSRPETFMDGYMASMTDDSWYDTLLENSSIAVTQFEDSSAVFDQYYQSTVTPGSYSYSKKIGRYSDEAPVYSLRSGGAEIALIGLVPAEDAGFGFNLWQLDYIQPSVNAGAISSAGVQIDVPAGSTVLLDGVVLDDSYITESHVDYDDIGDVEKRIEDRAHMVRYQVDGIYLNATVAVEGVGELEPYLVENGCYYYRSVPTERYSISVLTYSDMTVTLNGAELTLDDAQVSSWEVFEEFTDHIPDAPRICLYEIGGLYTQPKVTVTDMNGTVLQGVADESGTVVYNYPYDADLEAEQKQFVEDFLQKYVNFACGDYNYRYGLHSALTQYVLEGTVLKHYFFKSVSGGGDGGGMLGVEVHELSAGNFIRLRDNCYICTGILDATERRYDRDQEFHAEYMIVAIMHEGEWYIAAMPDQS